MSFLYANEPAANKLTRDSAGNLSYDDAVDEVVADACETMLVSSSTLQELAQENRTLFNTIRSWVNRFLDKFRKNAETYARHEEAKIMLQYADELQALWDKALKEAVNSRTETAGNSEQQVEAVEMVTEGGTTVGIQGDGIAQMSLRTYDEGGERALSDYLYYRVREGDLSKADADDMLTQMRNIYNVCKDLINTGKYEEFSKWSNAQVVVDKETGLPVFSVIKANGEYVMNLDFSLVCKKRRTLDAVMNLMVKRGIMDNFQMKEGSIAAINDIIRDYGFETACALCFVDSKRYRQGIVADAFVSMYNKAVRSIVGSGQHADSLTLATMALLNRPAPALIRCQMMRSTGPGLKAE